jgi:hypothetical protein
MLVKTNVNGIAGASQLTNVKPDKQWSDSLYVFVIGGFGNVCPADQREADRQKLSGLDEAPAQLGNPHLWSGVGRGRFCRRNCDARYLPNFE